MNRSHDSKFMLQVVVALLLLSIGIVAIVYGALGHHQHKEWTLWAFVAIITINTAILLVISATVHKVKAELLKRQRPRRGDNAAA